MAMKTKTKLCLASAAAAAVGVAVGAYFGNQPASDTSALLPMLGSFAVAFVSLVVALAFAPWGLLKRSPRKLEGGSAGESAYDRFRREGRFYGDHPGLPAGVPALGDMSNPALWEVYHGPLPGNLTKDR